MVRLIGFFVLLVIVYSLLGQLPWIGPVFQRAGCLGIWATAFALSWGLARYGERAVRVSRDRAVIRQLEAVGSAHHHGKIGTLYLNQGRVRRSLEHFEQATAGEPTVAEWHYRHGCALLILRRRAEAIEALSDCVTLDEGYAYGGALMRLVEALAGADRHEDALVGLDLYERNHGPIPESAYRRGLAHKRLGDKTAARAAFAEVGRLASETMRYQRRAAGIWVFRAKLARLF